MIPRDLDEQPPVARADDYGQRPRTVVVVHDQIVACVGQLENTLRIARDTVSAIREMRAELADLIRADRAKFHANLSNLDSIEQEIAQPIVSLVEEAAPPTTEEVKT